MGLFAKKTKEQKPANVDRAVPETAKREDKPPLAERQVPPLAYSIIRSPHITEKASGLTASGIYAFKISNRANKNMVKEAVESLYKVKVRAVRMVHMPSKKRRLGRFEGERKAFKKALVTLAPGYKIDIGVGA